MIIHEGVALPGECRDTVVMNMAGAFKLQLAVLENHNEDNKKASVRPRFIDTAELLLRFELSFRQNYRK